MNTDNFWFWLLVVGTIVAVCFAIVNNGYEAYMEEYELENCVVNEPCFDKQERY